jgi:beta-glucosidase
MEGGNAIADLLYGKSNFSGRLPQSWPTDVAHAGPAGSGSPTFTFDYYHGYRLLDRDGIAPLYPFGYGLSYTTFELSNAAVPCSSVTPNGVVRLSVTITNTGAVAGDETVQVYVGYPNTTQRRPIKELKAVRTERNIPPGMSRTVEIPLQVKHWAYFDEAADDWVVEQVPHEIWVGQNAGSVTLAGTVPVVAP